MADRKTDIITRDGVMSSLSRAPEYFCMKFTRRSVIRATAATLAAPALGALGVETFARSAAAQTQNWKHGLSLFGELKYPEGFKNFDYVNAAAPQGGVVRQVAFGTYDNFNQVVAGVKGSLALGTELFTETLMASALDEDPRYARKDHGSRLGRAGYALSHLVVCGRDSGRLGFNFAEVGGSAMAAGIANAYYPGGRTPNANLQRFGIAITADAGGNLLKEFWPDIRKWITGKRRCGPVLPQAFRDTGQSAVTARPL